MSQPTNTGPPRRQSVSDAVSTSVALYRTRTVSSELMRSSRSASSVVHVFVTCSSKESTSSHLSSFCPQRRIHHQCSPEPRINPSSRPSAASRCRPPQYSMTTGRPLISWRAAARIRTSTPKFPSSSARSGPSESSLQPQHQGQLHEVLWQQRHLLHRLRFRRVRASSLLISASSPSSNALASLTSEGQVGSLALRYGAKTFRSAQSPHSSALCRS
mmetsp:Transcript_21655/g.65093  ORF Transcript_21655/g.65093 Transcript_21655/m.65093 type:complete len:216 (-) Transcript_21655:89-736(-)